MMDQVLERCHAGYQAIFITAGAFWAPPTYLGAFFFLSSCFLRFPSFDDLRSAHHVVSFYSPLPASRSSTPLLYTKQPSRTHPAGICMHSLSFALASTAAKATHHTRSVS